MKLLSKQFNSLIKYYFNILLIASLSFFSLACEDEAKIIDSFPFAISVTGTNEALLTETLDNELTIFPENLSDDTVFSILYDAGGKGYYRIDGVKIEENTFYNLAIDSLTFQLEFVPEEQGEFSVYFFSTDNKKHLSETSVSYSITKPLTEFDFSFSVLESTVSAGEPTSINLNIEQTTDESLIYAVTIDSSSEGEISWGGTQNLPYTIENLGAGTINLSYIPTEVIEQNSFTVTVNSSNSLSKTETFDGIEVTPVAFDFTLSKTDVTVSENQFNEFIRVTLNRPTIGVNLRYEPQYYLIITTTTSDIFLSENNSSITFGTNIPIDDFSGITNETINYSLLFGDNVISGDIVFTIWNDTGYEVSKTVTVETDF